MSRLSQRLPPAAVFDWDGTLRRGLTMRAWFEYLSAENVIPLGRQRSMEFVLAREEDESYPYEDFAHDVVSEYARCIEHISVSDISTLAERFIVADSKNLFTFVIPLLALLREMKITTLVVSGCPEEVLIAYGKVLGIDTVVGAKSKMHEGRFTGSVQSNPALSKTKESEMRKVIQRYSVSLALGNTASDVPLLRYARIPVLFMAGDINVPGRAETKRVDHESELLPTIRELLAGARLS